MSAVRGRAPLTGVAGSRRIAVAVLVAASTRAGLIGLALMATRRRLVSDGNCGAGRFSRLAARPAQIAAITTSKPPVAPNA